MIENLVITKPICGKLLVLERAEDKGKRHYWRCLCDCGNIKIAEHYDLIHAQTQSCGCLRGERNRALFVSHGLSYSKEYNTYHSMMARCYNPKHKSYNNYGGRGIDVCLRWKEPNGQGFLNFLEDMGECPDGLSLDRINNNEGYGPDNCRWATTKEQQRNRNINRVLTLENESHCMGEWADIRGWSINMLWIRLKRGWTTEEALTIPIGTSRKQYYEGRI